MIRDYLQAWYPLKCCRQRQQLTLLVQCGMTTFSAVISHQNKLPGSRYQINSVLKCFQLSHYNSSFLDLHIAFGEHIAM